MLNVLGSIANEGNSCNKLFVGMVFCNTVNLYSWWPRNDAATLLLER